jgi:hypothetical protein
VSAYVAGMSRQVGEEIELSGGEPDPLAIARRLVADEMELEVADDQSLSVVNLAANIEVWAGYSAHLKRAAGNVCDVPVKQSSGDRVDLRYWLALMAGGEVAALTLRAKSSRDDEQVPASCRAQPL